MSATLPLLFILYFNLSFVIRKIFCRTFTWTVSIYLHVCCNLYSFSFFLIYLLIDWLIDSCIYLSSLSYTSVHSIFYALGGSDHTTFGFVSVCLPGKISTCAVLLVLFLYSIGTHIVICLVNPPLCIVHSLKIFFQSFGVAQQLWS